MNIISELEQAINEKSWQQICDIYKSLTGKDIALPNDQDIDLNNPVFLVEKLLKILKQKNNTNEIQTVKQQNTKKTRKNRKQDVNVNKNNIEEYGTIDETNLIENESVKPHHYGGKQVFITTDVDRDELTANTEKAKKTNLRKEPRPAPTMFKIKCSRCDEIFESQYSISGNVGSCCNKCLKSIR